MIKPGMAWFKVRLALLRIAWVVRRNTHVHTHQRVILNHKAYTQRIQVLLARMNNMVFEGFSSILLFRQMARSTLWLSVCG